MKIQRWSVRKYVFLAVIVALSLFSVVTVADTCCGCHTCPSKGWAKVETEKAMYRRGEEVNFTFFNNFSFTNSGALVLGKTSTLLVKFNERSRVGIFQQ